LDLCVFHIEVLSTKGATKRTNQQPGAITTARAKDCQITDAWSRDITSSRRNIGISKIQAVLVGERPLGKLEHASAAWNTTQNDVSTHHWQGLSNLIVARRKEDEGTPRICSTTASVGGGHRT